MRPHACFPPVVPLLLEGEGPHYQNTKLRWTNQSATTTTSISQYPPKVASTTGGFLVSCACAGLLRPHARQMSNFSDYVPPPIPAAELCEAASSGGRWGSGPCFSARWQCGAFWSCPERAEAESLLWHQIDPDAHSTLSARRPSSRTAHTPARQQRACEDGRTGGIWEHLGSSQKARTPVSRDGEEPSAIADASRCPHGSYLICPFTSPPPSGRPKSVLGKILVVGRERSSTVYHLTLAVDCGAGVGIQLGRRNCKQ